MTATRSVNAHGKGTVEEKNRMRLELRFLPAYCLFTPDNFVTLDVHVLDRDNGKPFS